LQSNILLAQTLGAHGMQVTLWLVQTLAAAALVLSVGLVFVELVIQSAP